MGLEFFSINVNIFKGGGGYGKKAQKKGGYGGGGWGGGYERAIVPVAAYDDDFEPIVADYAPFEYEPYFAPYYY